MLQLTTNRAKSPNLDVQAHCQNRYCHIQTFLKLVHSNESQLKYANLRAFLSGSSINNSYYKAIIKASHLSHWNWTAMFGQFVISLNSKYVVCTLLTCTTECTAGVVAALGLIGNLPGSTVEMQVCGDPAGLDSHQVTPDSWTK